MKYIISENQLVQIKLLRRFHMLEAEIDKSLEDYEKTLSNHHKEQGIVFIMLCDSGINKKVDSFMEEANELVSGRDFHFDQEGQPQMKELSKDEVEMENLIRGKVEASYREKLTPIYKKWCGKYRRPYEKVFGLTENDYISSAMKKKLDQLIDNLLSDRNNWQ